MNNFTNYLKLHVGSLQTADRYTKYLKQFFSKYNEFNQDNVNSFLTNCITHGRKTSFNVSISSFKHYANFTKVILEFPKSKKIIRKNMSSLTKEEIEKEILPYFPELFRDSKKRETIFRFMILSMMRKGEVINLKKQDVDFDTMKISIKSGKGDKDRITFLHESIKNDMIELINQSQTNYVFNIKKEYIEYMFRIINEKLQYKKHITPHTTRRAGAKFMVEQGIRVDHLQIILGHKSLETTRLYIETDIDEIHEAYKKIKYKKGV